MITNIIILVIGLLTISSRANAIIIGVPVAAIAVVKLVILLVSFISIPVTILIGILKRDVVKTIIFSVAVLSVIALLIYLMLRIFIGDTISSKLALNRDQIFSASIEVNKTVLGDFDANGLNIELTDVQIIGIFAEEIIKSTLIVFLPTVLISLLPHYYLQTSISKKKRLVISVLIGVLTSAITGFIFLIIRLMN